VDERFTDNGLLCKESNDFCAVCSKLRPVSFSFSSVSPRRFIAGLLSISDTVELCLREI
jgi:hypothetical protein